MDLLVGVALLPDVSQVQVNGLNLQFLLQFYTICAFSNAVLSCMSLLLELL